jgi:rare lipoprotein A
MLIRQPIANLAERSLWFDQTAMLIKLLIVMLSGLLFACGGGGYVQDGPPSKRVDVSSIPDAEPRATTRSKYGNPSSYKVFGKRYYVMPSSKGYKERGIASWYGSKFHGKRTSSGEPYDMYAMTAAHKTLPLPTYVKVTNLKNDRQVILKVNDRGPFHDNRIIDLSHTAAKKLGIIGTGTGLVEVEAIDPATWGKKPTKPKSPPAQAQVATTRLSDNQVNMYLQLGAFLSSNNAYQLKDKVNTVIRPDFASVTTTLKNDQQFYRVRIGPLDTVEYADTLTQTLNQNGFGSAHIVID